MNSRKKAFYTILAVVISTGLIFSLYAVSKIRSIHELRAAVEKTATERLQAIRKDSDSSTDAGKSAPKGAIVPPKMWTTEFIETAYNASQKYGIRNLTFEQKSSDSSRRQTPGNSRLSLQAYPVKMTFHAGYREMAEFLRELQDLDRLVTIDNLRVKSEKSYLAAEVTISTYAMEGK
ncbi:MAG: type 4a pilus biogenesis protein PilO [Nitrospirae bacterium]|nr:type 4a pilus biogenesis protein PilO [Nitrospirota bacterium]